MVKNKIFMYKSYIWNIFFEFITYIWDLSQTNFSVETGD